MCFECCDHREQGSMDKKLEDAFRAHAWTQTLIVWLVGAVALYGIFWLIGEVRDRETRWWLEASFYVVGFLYFLALGPIHSFFFNRLCDKAKN